MARAAFLQALGKAESGTEETEFLAQLVFQEPLIAEVQRLELVGEKDECRRRGACLSDVENLHFAAGWRGAARQVHFRDPAIQLAGGDAFIASCDDLVNQVVEAIYIFAGFGGEKNDRRVGKKFQARANQRFVILY